MHAESSRRPELFIALVGPVGTDLSEVLRAVESDLLQVGYECLEVHLSKRMESLRLKALKALPSNGAQYRRIKALMAAGDELRRVTGRDDALAVLASAFIADKREEAVKKKGFMPRRCYILRSLKRPEEAKTLREIYGPAFYLMAAYSPEDLRVKRLTKTLAASESASNIAAFKPKAQELINRDEDDEQNPHGQRLRDTFPIADVFVKASDRKSLQRGTHRFIQKLFGSQFLTPTVEERGMFHAKAAAVRSADLSRQVGAAIATSEGEIVAVGANEVPRFGGGLYSCEDSHDARDFCLGKNSNRLMKQRILSEILNKFKKSGWLNDNLSAKSSEELTGPALSVLKGARLMDLGEFGRTVHGEMAALMDAARRGVPVSGGTLYVTTFPCHNCAKHIVAAGIKRVVYIEPYPRSMARELHEDSIVVDPQNEVHDKVVFEQFIGIAPRRYIEMFEMGVRQTVSEELAAEPGLESLPISRVHFRAYRDLEKEHIEGLRKVLVKKKL